MRNNDQLFRSRSNGSTLHKSTYMHEHSHRQENWPSQAPEATYPLGGCIQMDDFKKSRCVPKKLLPRFPLSEEEPQRVPLQMPGEMRPGSFKVATKTPNASSPGRPEAAAAPAGLQSCGVDAVVQSRPGLDEPPVQSRRGRILTLTHPLLPWGHPHRVGKGTAAVRAQHRVGNRGTCSAAAGSRVPHQPSRSALAPQLQHQGGEPPPHRHPTAAAPLGKRRT